jgi:hypothetical protein
VTTKGVENMWRTSRAAGGALVCLLLLPGLAKAAIITIDARPNPPEGFYFIPERQIRTVLSDPEGIRRKLLGNPTRPWGQPHGIGFLLNPSSGQWYAFPVCHGVLITRGKIVEATDVILRLTCPRP